MGISMMTQDPCFNTAVEWWQDSKLEVGLCDSEEFLKQFKVTDYSQSLHRNTHA